MISQVLVLVGGVFIGVVGYFLKRMAESLDKIGEDIGEIKTSIARHEEKHDALQERVVKLEKLVA